MTCLLFSQVNLPFGADGNPGQVARHRAGVETGNVVVIAPSLISRQKLRPKRKGWSTRTEVSISSRDLRTGTRPRRMWADRDVGIGYRQGHSDSGLTKRNRSSSDSLDKLRVSIRLCASEGIRVKAQLATLMLARVSIFWKCGSSMTSQKVPYFICLPLPTSGMGKVWPAGRIRPPRPYVRPPE